MDAAAKTGRAGRRRRPKGDRVLAHLLLAGYGLIIVLPLLWMLSMSLRESAAIFENPWALPTELRWGNYVAAWQDAGIARGFANSVLVVAPSLFLLLLTGSMAAYALTRFPFRGASGLLTLFIGGMTFPIFLGAVPVFVLLRQFNLLDTHAGIILAYVGWSLPFTVFILSGFFRQLPGELAEAARIDGCSQFGVFWKVMLPLARPGLAIAGIFNFIGLWNEYPLALVLLPSAENRTLPLAVAKLSMVQQYQSDWGVLFAGLVIVVLPALVIYIIWQRQIAAGLAAGALKG